MNEEEKLRVDFFREEEEQVPTKTGTPVFSAPFGAKFGNSTVDLDIKSRSI